MNERLCEHTSLCEMYAGVCIWTYIKDEGLLCYACVLAYVKYIIAYCLGHSKQIDIFSENR